MARTYTEEDKEYNKQWRLEHPNKFKEYGRKWRQNNPDYQMMAWLRHRWKMTVEDYQKLLVGQGGVCAICKQKEKSRGGKNKVRNLAVDHNHITGKIRGLLCYECNIGLGKFSDSIDKLENALEYLRSHNG